MFADALNDWTSKWVPAVLQYTANLSGKKAALASQTRKDCEGMTEM